MDEYSFRDLWVMIDAVREERERKNEDEWRRTLTITQAIINTVSKKPKRLDHMWPNKERLQAGLEFRTLAEYREWRDKAQALVMKRLQERKSVE